MLGIWDCSIDIIPHSSRVDESASGVPCCSQPEEVQLDGFCVNRETGALSSYLHRGKANLIHISEVWRLRSFEDSLHEIIFSGVSLIVPSFLPHRKPLISLLSTGGVVSHWCKFAKTLREMSWCHASWSVPEPQIQLSFPLELCDWMC